MRGLIGNMFAISKMIKDNLFEISHQLLKGINARMCPEQLFVVGYTRKDTGGAKFRKHSLWLKLTDNTEFSGADGKDIENLNRDRQLFS